MEYKCINVFSMQGALQPDSRKNMQAQDCRLATGANAESRWEGTTRVGKKEIIPLEIPIGKLDGPPDTGQRLLPGLVTLE